MRLAVTTILLATACYGAAPPRPATIPLPPISADAEVIVETQSTTEIENVAKESSTCPQGKGEGHPDCVITRYTVAQPVTRTRSRASYNGAPISYGQFQVLTDSEYGQKLSRLGDLSTKCQRANVPRYVGMGLMLGGVVALAAFKSSDAGLWAGYGGIAGGGASYALGYFAFGGRQCVEARGLYTALDMSEEASWEEVQGRARAEEMATLAERFNARNRTTSAMQMRDAR